jgi:hypothetical protein
MKMLAIQVHSLQCLPFRQFVVETKLIQFENFQGAENKSVPGGKTIQGA